MSTENLLWVDKHRPSSFQQLTYHPNLTNQLRNLSTTSDIPHLLFYGPSGAGKRTRVICLLRNLFGPTAEKKKVVHRLFKIAQTSTQLELTIVASSCHVEVNPSESANNDRLVVQELIKDMASFAPLDLSTPPSANSSRRPIKVIVIHEVDRMSRLAQQALRRTMEKYSATCRIIMIAESLSNVLEPLRSRCLGVRVPLPDESAVRTALFAVARKEGITLPDQLATHLVKSSNRNLRRALLQLEATRVTVGSPTLPPDTSVMRADWEYACKDAAILVTRAQTVSQLVLVRKRIQDLLSRAVPPDVVLRRFVQDILAIVDDEICPEICRVAAKFDHSLTNGTKPIVHIEAFAARFMQIYSQFLRAQAALID